MHLLRLVEHQVQIGQPLPFGIRDEHGQLLLARGQVVASAAQLAALLERGASVDIEEVRAAAQRSEAVEARPPSLFAQWERLLWQLDRALRAVAEPSFVAAIDAVVAKLAELVDRDADIAIYLTVRQDPKRLSIYALAHSVHCTVVGLLMARRLGWDAATTQTLLRAALTMNIATLDLQGRLAAQGNKPTPAQMDQIRRHPAQGAEMLGEAGATDAAWLRTVAEHHERRDGSGYPTGTRDVCDLAVALRCLDVFMAKMAPRAMRPPLPTQLAARQLFQEDQGGPVSAAIIKEFGIFPPGEFVQLKSGEQAVVVRRGAGVNTPVAAAITDRNGIPTVNTVRRDTAKPEFAVSALIGSTKLVLRVPPERLFGLPE